MPTRPAAKLVDLPEKKSELSPKEHNQELLQTLQREPELGGRRLFKRYSREVNQQVWRLLGADPEHNDVVQQVFLKVLLQHHTLRDPDKLGAWIQVITVNTIYQELRRRERQRWLRLSWRPPQLHGDLVQEMEARDFLLAALGLIGRLPGKERIVFSLRFVEGKTVPEIAMLCGFSEGTTKRRLSAALERFERLVSGHRELAQWLEQLQERTA